MLDQIEDHEVELEVTMTGKKAVNGGGSQDSRSGSIPPPLPPSSDAAIPSSDSLALPGPSSKKLFPLFETKARKNGKATPSVGNSDLESNATLSESSQGAAKPKKKATAAASKGKSKGNGASNSQQSDASTSAKEKGSKPRKASQDKSNQINKSAVKSNKRSKSPRLSIDLEDPNTTISTVASTSTSSTTPPPEPHKTVITITDSPVRELKATKTFADLEAERLAKKAAKEAGGWNGGREPLWPSQATMHVFPHGSMLERRDRPSCARRDWKGKGRAVENDSDYQGKAGVSSDHIRSIVLQYTTFGEHKKHMQIADEADVSEHIRHRLSEPSRNEVSDHAQQCWYMRYAPTKAADVLGDGNRENAMYLRDWLKELTLQGTSRLSAVK